MLGSREDSIPEEEVKQLDLPILPRARRTDPVASHLAADTAERTGTISKQAAIVLAAVVEFPGLTSKQLATVCELDRYQIARRLPEMEQCGLVRREELPGARRESIWFQKR
jgi:DNA-binding MarR family transcriptional regulator